MGGAVNSCGWVGAVVTSSLGSMDLEVDGCGEVNWVKGSCTSV